jgi:hypothetical protein
MKVDTAGIFITIFATSCFTFYQTKNILFSFSLNLYYFLNKVFNNQSNEENKKPITDTTTPPDRQIPYEDKYLKELSVVDQTVISQERLEQLANGFVMEHTPLGNVLMMYDYKKEAFKYYSDNTIPYRYLETVGRKYVKQFQCYSLFINMDEQLNNAKQRLSKIDEKQNTTVELTKDKDKDIIQPIIPNKKNVFAKLKTYNKEAGSKSITMAAPSKNNIQTKNTIKEELNVLLKEKSNVYSYQGKINNFNFLKRVDKKLVDKKYSVTFAEFKNFQFLQ